jgi:organic hydroperoxide reductase OsmC/OhrA
MLTFLAIASYQGFTIDSYVDEAVGILGKNESGKMAVTQVTLKPTIQFSGEKLPSEEELNALHDKAHRECFIANSVTTEVNLSSG